MSKNVVDMTLRANMDLSQVSSGLNQMQSILKQLKLSPSLKKEFDSLFTDAANQLEKYQSKLESGFKTKGDIAGFDKIAQGLEKSLGKIDTAWTKLQGKDLSNLVKLDSSSVARVQEIENSFKTLGQELKTNVATQLKDVAAKIQLLNTSTSKKAGISIAEMLGAGQYREALSLLDQYIAKQEKVKGRGGKYETTYNNYDAIRTSLLGVIAELDKYDQKVNSLNTEKLDIMASATEKTSQKLQQGANVLTNLTQKTHEYSNATKESATKTVELGNDLDMLKSRVQYFFSLTNSVMLFRRILQDTIQTTKELDAAMTETAVVTDFSVSDMWKELPRYTALAKELGATIQGVYETMTLYYQQGLETNEVFEVGTETLKMARIAGLDYAKATDYMTAALRGFNMEVNELNAQRINDVYSELAAITAADTQEIATAMTKTASIASNANMEFETTAAFLSQIIETTRESAETAGTAMKTVIARFTELKKDPAEIGEVDGEIVDANKIETALRTIDVALRDTNGQFRELDDVFLDISAKWDGLDTNTQRYIATMAAGSRQQSRFIAMMSDYSRTMELVNAANNSAGASQKQFDKTLESLEAKLNQLKDAWDQFTMGIANNTLIKAGIDAITGLLNIVNKLTEHLPGATKGLANLLLMIGGFSAGKKVMDAFFASTVSNIANLGKVGAEGGVAYGVSFREALNKEFGKTGKTFKAFNKKIANTGATFDTSLRKVKKGYGTDFEAEKASGINKATYLNWKDRDDLTPKQTAEMKTYNEVLQKRTQLENASFAAKKNFLGAVEAGVPLQTAELALKDKLTDEEYKQLAIQSLINGSNKLENELTEEEIKDRIALIKSKQAEFAADQMGLVTKAKHVALMIFGSEETKKDSQEKLINAGATWAEKYATDAFNGSLAATALLVGGVTIGIAALVAIMALLIKNAKENTLEYKMEKAAEATEKAKQAADGAKQAYDDLNSSIEKIGTAETELENLTYGTIEWQKALLDVNQQVLDLIDKFPQLKQQLLNELQVEASGKLTLSKEGYELIRKQSLGQYQNAVAGQIISGSYESFLNKQAALGNYNNYNELVVSVDPDTGKKIENSASNKAVRGIEYFLAMLSTAYGTNGSQIVNSIESANDSSEAIYSENKISTITNAQKDKIYEKFVSAPKLFEKNGKDSSGTTIEQFSQSIGMLSDEVLATIPIMRKRRAAELEYEASVRAQAKQLILSSTSENFQAKDNSRQIADTFSQFYAKEQANLITDEVNKIDGNNLSEYAQKFGIDNFIHQGSELKNLQKLYQELTGSTKEQVEEMFGEGKDELKKAIASIKVGKDWGKKVENFATELEKFSDGIKGNKGEKVIKQLFGGADGTGFTKTGLENFNTNTLEKFWEDNAEIQSQFDDKDAFIDWAKSQKEKAQEAYNTAVKNLELFDFNADEMFSDKLNTGAISGLAQNLIDVFAISGKKGVDSLSKQISSITDRLDEEKANNFVAALNGIDWTNREQVLAFSETLDELGIHIDPTTGNIDQLEQEIIKLAKATTKVSLENLIEAIQNLGAIAVDLMTKEIDNRSLSKEEVDTLVSTGAMEQKDFTFNVETGEYTYLGESTDRIVAAIQEQTSALLGEDEYEKKIESGETVKTLKEQDDFKNISTTDYEGKLEFLNAYNEKMGVYSKEYLQKLTDVGDAAIQEAIDKHYDELINDYLSIESNQKKLDDAKYQGGVVDAQINNTPKELAMRIDQLRGTDGTSISEEDQKKIDTYTAALTNQAEAAGVAQSKIDEYRQKLIELENAETDEDIEKLTKKVKELEKELSDTTGFNKTNKAMASTVEKTIDLLDEYEDLKDESSKIQQVQKMVDNFDLGDDIKVDTSNYQDVYDYMLGIARGSHEAYLGLMNLAMKEYGVKVTAQGDFTDLNGKFIKMTDNFKDFINLMLQNGQFVEETVTVTNEQDYVGALKKVVGKDGTITYKPIKEKLKVGSQITVVRPKNAGEIKTVSNLGSGGPSYTPSGNSDSGGSGNKWENPYDAFYNSNEEINDLIRERNDLEREYEKILQDENATVDDYYNNYMARLKNYNQEIGKQKQILNSRKLDQKRILSENSHLSQYAWIEDGKIQINFDKINKVTDEDKGQEIEEYIQLLEENTEAIEEAEAAVDEAEIAVKDLIKSWKEETANFEREIFDALVESREKDIEMMEGISDTLDEAASNLISAIQEEINNRRQERDNKETEEDILDKEKRLAFLQQDTSGAYDQEILELQKELTEQKEDYTDTLIDQKISNLERQNEEAAKQRERQIKIAQTQLKYDIENGKIADQSRQMLEAANSKAGKEDLWDLFAKSDAYEKMTRFERELYEQEFITKLNTSLGFLKASGDGSLAQVISDNNKNLIGQVLEEVNTSKSDKNKTDDEQTVVNTVYDEEEAERRRKAEEETKKAKKKKQAKKEVQDYVTSHTMLEGDKNRWGEDSQFKKLFDKYRKLGGNINDIIGLPTPEKKKYYDVGFLHQDVDFSEKNTKEKAKEYVKERGIKTVDGTEFIEWNGLLYKLSELQFKTRKRGNQTLYTSYLPKGTIGYTYKTGGLADYTGPAWLDGTKSKPELVLNQVDTKNFLALKDVLGDFMKNNSSSINTNNQVGDTNYEISINVEKMNSDYDVEQVANKIKQMISSDASYRNSNLISRLR